MNSIKIKDVTALTKELLNIEPNQEIPINDFFILYKKEKKITKIVINNSRRTKSLHIKLNKDLSFCGLWLHNPLNILFTGENLNITSESSPQEVEFINFWCLFFHTYSIAKKIATF